MGQEIDNKAVFAIADKFIALANELAEQDNNGTIGMGIRYAAARYNSFESSMMTTDLAADKERMLDLFTEDYRKMMSENIDDYIQLLASRKNDG